MEHHIVPKSTYYQVTAWLAVLLVLTVAAYQIDLGIWNVPIALAIATAKAVPIVLVFMHVQYGSPLLKLFAAAGFFWLLILLGLTMTDVLWRY